MRHPNGLPFSTFGASHWRFRFNLPDQGFSSAPLPPVRWRGCWHAQFNRGIPHRRALLFQQVFSRHYRLTSWRKTAIHATNRIRLLRRRCTSRINLRQEGAEGARGSSCAWPVHYGRLFEGRKVSSASPGGCRKRLPTTGSCLHQSSFHLAAEDGLRLGLVWEGSLATRLQARLPSSATLPHLPALHHSGTTAPYPTTLPSCAHHHSTTTTPPCHLLHFLGSLPMVRFFSGVRYHAAPQKQAAARQSPRLSSAWLTPLQIF